MVSAARLFGVSLVPMGRAPGASRHTGSLPLFPQATQTPGRAVTFSGVQGPFRAEGNAFLMSYLSPEIHESS